MNLHTLEAPEDEDVREPDGSCENCGESKWERTESGWKQERHTIRFPGGYEDWDIDNEGIEETTPWKCYGCGEIADDDTQDWIEDHR